MLEFLLISDFLAESFKANKNYQKDHSFYNVISLIKPHLFFKPQFNQHCKKYTAATQPKTLLILQIFQQTFALNYF